VRDDHPGTAPLTRDPQGPGLYSASGIFGDPTLAARSKGKILVEGLTTALLADIAALREAPLPSTAPVP